MTPINKLRAIVNSCRDTDVAILVERWIQDHVLEFANTMHLSEQAKRKNYAGMLELSSERQCTNLAATIIKDGANVEEREEMFGTVTTRRIWVIKE